MTWILLFKDARRQGGKCRWEEAREEVFLFWQEVRGRVRYEPRARGDSCRCINCPRVPASVWWVGHHHNYVWVRSWACADGVKKKVQRCARLDTAPCFCRWLAAYLLPDSKSSESGKWIQRSNAAEAQETKWISSTPQTALNMVQRRVERAGRASRRSSANCSSANEALNCSAAYDLFQWNISC